MFAHTDWVRLARQQAERFADKPAYLFLQDGELPGETVSFSELDLAARALAVHLRRICLPGDRALLLYPPCIDYMVAFFGCLYAGVIAVPVFAPTARKHNARLEAIAADCQARVVLTVSGQMAARPPEPSIISPLSRALWVATDIVDPALARKWRQPPIHPDATAFLQYTSGSTGTPKGVVISHRNLLYNEAMIAKGLATNADSTFVSWLPIYHDMGLIGNMLHAFYSGASCVFMAPVSFLQRPIRWLRAISQYGAHVSGGPNFGFELCAQKVTEAQRDELDLSTWRIAFNGAEPVRYATLDRFARSFAGCGFRETAFYPCYGMAETTLIVSGRAAEETPSIAWFDKDELTRDRAVKTSREASGAQALVGCGSTLLDQKIRIVNPVDRHGCPDGNVGEIWVGGDNVGGGYWNRPDESEQTFGAVIADTGEGPFLRTGDLGFLQDRELYITGRLKDLIIVNGVNHYPQDIEMTVEEVDAAIRTAGVAAFSVADESAERVVAVVEIDRAHIHMLDREQLTARIKQAVLEQHELRVEDVAFIMPGTLPKTSSGKVQRGTCRERYLAGNLDRLKERSPRRRAAEASRP